MSEYSDLVNFQRSIVRGNWAPGHKYLGNFQDFVRAGQYTPRIKTENMHFQQTPKTWRGCLRCMATGVQTIKHVTGQITIGPCMTCEGRRAVYG